MIYRIPYAFEMYGRVEVEADSLDKAYKKAADSLDKAYKKAADELDKAYKKAADE